MNGQSYTKHQMNAFYEARSKRMIDKMRGQEIDDQVYDIHKLQSQRKYEGQKKISELKIGDKVYNGTNDVVNAIDEKMKEELEAYGDVEFNAPMSSEEENFISKLEVVQSTLTEEEKEDLVKPINQEELFFILDQ